MYITPELNDNVRYNRDYVILPFLVSSKTIDKIEKKHNNIKLDRRFYLVANIVNPLGESAAYISDSVLLKAIEKERRNTPLNGIPHLPSFEISCDSVIEAWCEFLEAQREEQKEYKEKKKAKEEALTEYKKYFIKEHGSERLKKLEEKGFTSSKLYLKELLESKEHCFEKVVYEHQDSYTLVSLEEEPSLETMNAMDKINEQLFTTFFSNLFLDNPIMEIKTIKIADSGAHKIAQYDNSDAIVVTNFLDNYSLVHIVDKEY